ncbi:hypothetical protein [Pseudomonas citronellolis]|uniref:hypothetical protein n=1 Tax=Pseudomonas citronellolis TaxID=53408 RepID=UPI0023E37348|nr:hypothetical protein [Pseudomonas citronellolis]MDF3932111.1 hypothetical protein [Pseudomonas citronellolis]
MFFDIRLMRRNGKPIPRRLFDSAKPFRGDVQIRYDHHTPLGRTSLIAETLKLGPSDQALPKLYDIQIHGMGTNALVITGFEFHGDTSYSQSWHCRLPPPPQ